MKWTDDELIAVAKALPTEIPEKGLAALHILNALEPFVEARAIKRRRLEAIAEDYERHPCTMGNVGSFAAEIRAALR